MSAQKNSNTGVLLVVPLGLAIFSYSKGYSFGKGALITVFGTLAIGVVLGVGTVGYMTYDLINKDYTK
jgi:hypothetical protein